MFPKMAHNTKIDEINLKLPTCSKWFYKMGLYTTHDCWRGSYSSFNRFRYSLAEQIGINLDDYSGYNENELMPLFNHSDCDGILTVEEHEKYQEAKLNKRLNDLLNTLTENLKNGETLNLN